MLAKNLQQFMMKQALGNPTPPPGLSPLNKQIWLMGAVNTLEGRELEEALSPNSLVHATPEFRARIMRLMKGLKNRVISDIPESLERNPGYNFDFGMSPGEEKHYAGELAGFRQQALGAIRNPEGITWPAVTTEPAFRDWTDDILQRFGPGSSPHPQKSKQQSRLVSSTDTDKKVEETPAVKVEETPVVKKVPLKD